MTLSEMNNHLRRMVGSHYGEVDIGWPVLSGSRSMYSKLFNSDVEPYWLPDLKQHFRAGADYDFCVDAKHLHLFMQFAQVFHKENITFDFSHPYMDRMAVAIMHCPEQNAQYVFRTNLRIWKSIWDKIDPVFFFENMWKSLPSAVSLRNYKMETTGRLYVSQDEVRDMMNTFYSVASVPPSCLVDHGNFVSFEKTGGVKIVDAYSDEDWLNEK